MDLTGDGILKILGVVSPIVLLLVTAVLKRRYDRALAAKTEAETVAQHTLTEKARTEIGGMVLDQATRLVGEFRQYQAEKDKLSAEKMDMINARMSRMEDYFARLRAALAVHGTWDAAALIELREHHDDYPEPPRIPDTLEDR